MSSTRKTALPIILGTMTFGLGKEARITDVKETERLIDIFQSYGHNELDTARVYNSGSTEEFLGEIGITSKNLIVATKLYPQAAVGTTFDPTATPSHRPESLAHFLPISLAALKLDKVDIYYLHAPDPTTPVSQSLSTLQTLYEKGLFSTLGISNYKSWEVALICQLCKAHNWILPKVYQGVYNVIHREIEAELIPCLRHYGLSFYAYNPLAGGFFTGTGPKSIDASVAAGTRFDDSKGQGVMYRKRYWKQSYFDAMALVSPIVEAKGLRLGEVALRWIMHHGVLKDEKGDKVIIGASSEAHLRENLEDLEKGELDTELLEVLDKAWLTVKGECETYWRNYLPEEV